MKVAILKKQGYFIAFWEQESDCDKNIFVFTASFWNKGVEIVYVVKRDRSKET